MATQMPQNPQEVMGQVLCDADLHQLAMQIDSLLPGGADGTVWTIVGILLIVVLVILLATLL